MANENQNEPDTHLLEDLASESRRSASKGVLCERCGEPLTGNKERWCSDRCRMRDRRDEERRRRMDLLDIISAAVKELRAELVRRVEP
jgi:predicted nucleic acid-binding Zn ribbon protein